MDVCLLRFLRLVACGLADAGCAFATSGFVSAGRMVELKGLR